MSRVACVLVAMAISVCGTAMIAEPEASRAVVTAPDLPDLEPAPPVAAPLASPVPRPAQRAAQPASAAEQAKARLVFQGPALPRPRRRIPASCTPDGAHCIGPLTYLQDVCTTIGATARDAGLDPHFFARLIWRESLFDAYAISHAGALGIAQFIPSTAALRGLEDPFNPAAALQASAQYLSVLRDQFGNLGLAAGAYNGGEARMARYLDGAGGLPGETRAYIHWITGHPAEIWRSAPPRKLDLSLRPGEDFDEACVTWAKAHKGPSRKPGEHRLPWAMIYAAHASEETAAERAEDMRSKFPALLGDAAEKLQRKRMPGSQKLLYTAHIDTESRMTAARLCTRLRRAGGGCMVLRN